MPDSREIGQELRQIRGLPYGVARTAAAEQIVRRIEADGPPDRLAEALLDLVEAYTFFGDGAKSFVAFARLLRLWDTNPELFDEADARNLFWEFKWVAGDLPDYAEIGVDQAQAFLADMRRRFDLAGHGLSSVVMSEFRWAWHTGNPDAETARLRWVAIPRDEFDDCRACTIGQQVGFFTAAGRYAEAIALGLTQDGRCNREPTGTFHALALAYLLHGDPETAVDYHRKALATLDKFDGSDFAIGRAQEFELLARGGQLERALRRLREVYPELLTKAATPLSRLRFLLGVLAGLVANADQPELATGLRESGRGTVGELSAWARTEAEALAARFDARNGNDYYANLVRGALAATRAGQLELDVAMPAVPAPAEASPQPATETADADPAALAEQHLARGDQRAAASAYAEAAVAAEVAGMLADAGVAWAESAHCAELMGDLAAANERYARALPRLRASGAEAEVLVQIMLAWAPVAISVYQPEPVLAELDLVGSIVDTQLAADDASPRRKDSVGYWRATLADCFARVVASLPPEHRTGETSVEAAIAAAGRAGEEFAKAGKVTDAAHAFWLAGRLQRDAGDTENALWSLESAFEGFAVAHDRKALADAAGDFIDLLRTSGQESRAEAVVAQLSK